MRQKVCNIDAYRFHGYLGDIVWRGFGGRYNIGKGERLKGANRVGVDPARVKRRLDPSFLQTGSSRLLNFYEW
jgi:hypothetical protein